MVKGAQTTRIWRGRDDHSFENHLIGKKSENKVIFVFNGCSQECYKTWRNISLCMPWNNFQGQHFYIKVSTSVDEMLKNFKICIRLLPPYNRMNTNANNLFCLLFYFYHDGCCCCCFIITIIIIIFVRFFFVFLSFAGYFKQFKTHY